MLWGEIWRLSDTFKTRCWSEICSSFFKVLNTDPYSVYVCRANLIRVHRLAIRTKQEPSPPGLRSPLTRPSLVPNRKMHVLWCEHTTIRAQKSRPGVIHIMRIRTPPHTTVAQCRNVYVCVRACLEYTYTHSLTLMPGFISSPWRCPLRSVDNRSGDGGNMAISWACRDREQTRVSFNVWEQFAKMLVSRYAWNVCVCVCKDLHQLGLQYCLFVPQSLILLMKILNFSLLFTTVTQLHHKQGAETVNVSVKDINHTHPFHICGGLRKSIGSHCGQNTVGFFPRVEYTLTSQLYENIAIFHQNDMKMFYLLVNLV